MTVSYGGACDVNASPYINQCGYDQAKDILTTIYGPLRDKAGQLSSKVVPFDQREFVRDGKTASNGMLDIGYLYVPASCKGSSAHCRLHVVLHGCKQSSQSLGDQFYSHVGVNEWADTNNIVVLYPQARTITAVDFKPARQSDKFNVNPEGCWNWFGYGYDNRYLFKDGVQISAIWGMVQRLSGR